MDDEPERSVWGVLWGVLQVAMLIGFIAVVSFGVYNLFQARVHHHF